MPKSIRLPSPCRAAARRRALRKVRKKLYTLDNRLKANCVANGKIEFPLASSRSRRGRLGFRQVLPRFLVVSPAFLVALEILFPVHAYLLLPPVIGPEDHNIGMLGEGPRLLRLGSSRPFPAVDPFSSRTRAGDREGRPGIRAPMRSSWAPYARNPLCTFVFIYRFEFRDCQGPADPVKGGQSDFGLANSASFRSLMLGSFSTSCRSQPRCPAP